MIEWLKSEICKVPSTLFQWIIRVSVVAGFVGLIYRIHSHLLNQVKLPLWSVLILAIGSALAVLIVAFRIYEKYSKPKWVKFTSAYLDGCNWKWKWEGENVSDLNPYCPSCGAELDITYELAGALNAAKAFCPVCNRGIGQYMGVRDFPEQSRKKIIHMRDSGEYLKPKI